MPAPADVPLRCQIVALAHELEWSVVTHEISAPDSKTNVKIPDVCRALGEHYVARRPIPPKVQLMVEETFPGNSARSGADASTKSRSCPKGCTGPAT